MQHLSPHPTTAASSSSSLHTSRYRYTVDPSGVLSPSQRQQYEEKGYILIKKLVSEDEIERWRARFVAIANGEIEPPATMTVMRDVAIAKRKEKGEKAITKIQDWQDDPVLFSYCSHPHVIKYVEAIIGGDFKSVHTMVRRGERRNRRREEERGEEAQRGR